MFNINLNNFTMYFFQIMVQIKSDREGIEKNYLCMINKRTQYLENSLASEAIKTFLQAVPGCCFPASERIVLAVIRI